MLTINFYIVGKIKEKSLDALKDEYLKRLSKYVKYSVTYINESYVSDETNSNLIYKALEKEGELILNKIEKEGRQNSFLILLDLHGEMMDSIKFSKKIEEICSSSYSTVNVVIGSSYGISDRVRQRANLKLCLSEMTFTHPMTLLLIIEQIYRAFKIINKETYHK